MINNDNLFPGILSYPSLPIYVSYLIQKSYLKISTDKNFDHNNFKFETKMYPYFSQAKSVMLVRFFVVSMSTLMLFLVSYFTLHITKSYFYMFFTTVLLCFSELISYHTYAYVNLDIFASFFVILNLAFLMYIKKEAKFTFLVLVPALLTGLAISSKYPHGLIIIPHILRIFLNKGLILRHKLLFTICLGIFSLITFLCCCPYVVIFFKTWVSSIVATSEIYNAGWLGYTVESGFPNLLLQLKQFYHEFGLTSFVLFLFGLFFIPIKFSWGLGLISYFTVFLIYFCTHSVNLVRNILPLYVLFPFISVLGLYYIENLIKNNKLRFAIRFLVIVLAIVFFPKEKIERIFLNSSLETRKLALIKIEEHVPEGSTILISSEIGLQVEHLADYNVSELSFIKTDIAEKISRNSSDDQNIYFVIPEFNADLRWPNGAVKADQLNKKFNVKELLCFIEGRIGGSHNYLNLSAAGVSVNYIPPVPWGNPSIYIGRGLTISKSP